MNERPPPDPHASSSSWLAVADPRAVAPEGVCELGLPDSTRLAAGTNLTCEAEDAPIVFAAHPASAVST